MVRTHWLDLLIIVLPFFRPLRAGRALRALRLVTVAGRVTVGVRRAFGRKGFTPFLVAVGAVIVSCGVGVWLVEREVADAQVTTLADAMWWAIVTSTTVGYGDMVPVTPVGRGIAVLLMVTGVALLSVVTANIAAFFVEEAEAADHEVQDRLARIESLLLELGEGTTD